MQTQKWFKTLNNMFYQCFTKIRSRKRKRVITEVDVLLEKRKKLRRETEEDNSKAILKIEEEIGRISNWKDAKEVWKKFQDVADSDNSSSTQAMWKWKKKLFPKVKPSPPMGIKDIKGEVKIKGQDIQDIYQKEYKHRLRPRPILPEIQDLEALQDQLFKVRLESASKIISPPWKISELDKVLSSLKSGKSRDPSGLLSNIFKKPVCGTDLKLSLLTLLNKTKETQQIPSFFSNSNISSIWKKKGDILDLEFHRGIFLGSIFKTIMMKLIYFRNYSTIDSNMSESNVGGRKGRNCRDHIFVVNGAIQDALSSKHAKPLDLLICDYKTMFDGLDVRTTLNDLYDNGVKDDSFAAIYRLYENNNISIKTPVGLTERRQVDRPIITQGDCLGPILASSTVDTFGKECYQKDKHLYWYKNITPVSLLTMIDDVLALSLCGPQSTKIQEYINIKTGSKKLQFSTGKTYQMHIGSKKPDYKCEQSYIDSWKTDKTQLYSKDMYAGQVKVKVTYSTKYLGEVISTDGKNTDNITQRRNRGFGTIKDIVKILDNMCLGPLMFQKAVVLRDSMLVGTLLTCSEAWYNITESDMVQLEQLDKALWSNILEVARTVPYDLVCLELGLEPLRYIIMRRRMLYLQHILKQKDTSLIKQFLKTQMKDLKKKDWGKTIQENLQHLQIDWTFEEIENIPKATYKKIVKKRIKEKSFEYLLNLRNKRNGKGMDIDYTELRMQNYLRCEDLDITNDERKLIFQLRTKMCFKVKSHFRSMHLNIVCEGCLTEESTTKHTLECPDLIGKNELVTYLPDYKDLYEEDEDLQAYIARIFKDNLRRLPKDY